MYTIREGDYTEDLRMKRNYAFEAGGLFLLGLVVPQVIMPFFYSLGLQDPMLSQVLFQGLTVLPCVLYLVIQRKPLRESVGLLPLKVKQWLLLLPIVICINTITEWVNVASQLFADNQIGVSIFELINEYSFPVAFFVFAIVPAVIEELIFRGAVYQCYRRYSVRTAVLLTAFLFGIMHMNLNQCSYAIVIGFLFALVNEIAGSILPSMVMHLYINGSSVVLGAFSLRYLKGLREQYVEAELAGNSLEMEELLEAAQGVPISSADWLEQYLAAEPESMGEMLLSLTPGFLVAAVVLFFLLRYYAKLSGRTEHMKNIFRRRKDTEEPRASVFSVPLLLGCLLCFVVMLAELVL